MRNSVENHVEITSSILKCLIWLSYNTIVFRQIFRLQKTNVMKMKINLQNSESAAIMPLFINIKLSVDVYTRLSEPKRFD